MNKEMLEKAKNIARCGTQEKYAEAQELLLKHLEKNLYDTDAWVLLARIECNSPFEDPIRIIHYAGHVLAYDPSNAYALLLLAFGYRLLGSDDSEIVYAGLCLAEHSDPEVMAMIEVAKAAHFKYTNLVEYEKILKKSIAYSGNQQENLARLGKLYMKQGHVERGRSLIKKAITNVTVIDGEYDPTSIENFFAYYYKGTRLPRWVYEELMLVLESGSGADFEST